MSNASQVKAGNKFEPFSLIDPRSGINVTDERITHSTDLAADHEMPTSVSVEGTTFIAVYGVVNGFVELVSADLGDGRVPLRGRPARLAAKELLWTMATEEISRTEIPFLPDYGHKNSEAATVKQWTPPPCSSPLLSNRLMNACC